MPGVAQKKRRLFRVVTGLAALAVVAGAARLGRVAAPRRRCDGAGQARRYGAGRLGPPPYRRRVGGFEGSGRMIAVLRCGIWPGPRYGSGADDAALAIYPRLEEQALEFRGLCLVGNGVRARGLDESATRAYCKAVEMGQLPPRSLDELACLHLRAQRWKEAAPVAERLARQPGWEARGLMMLGTIRASLENVSGAALSFQRARPRPGGDRPLRSTGQAPQADRLDLSADGPTRSRPEDIVVDRGSRA